MTINERPEKLIIYNQDHPQYGRYTMSTGTNENGEQFMTFGSGYCDDNTKYNGTKQNSNEPYL